MAELNQESKFERIKREISGFPDSPGVYLFKNSHGVVLYVGKAVSLRKRVSSYFNQASQESPKVRSLTALVDHLEFILTEDESKAFLLESNLIKRYRPRYNVVLRDDKSYPYLKLTVQEDFPRILVSRRAQADGAKYYGPYPNLKLRETVKLIYRYFNIRDCDLEIDGKAERACLSYQIKQCPAPCVGLIQKQDYGRLVKRVQWFLEGKHGELMEHVRSEMLKAAERQEYEEAAKYRDLLSSIEQMQKNYSVITSEKTDLDVVALAAGTAKTLASVLQVRQGKVIDHVRLTLENELDLPLNEVLPLFLEQFYGPGVFIPDEVLVSGELLPDLALAQWLSRLKGTTTEVKAAEGGWRKELLALAEKNALEALREDVQRTSVLEDLKGLLGLKALPRTIACFDISTLQGAFTVGSAVLFKDGAPEKSRYRKFKIKELKGQDDYRAHQEMMRRYLALIDREGNPPPDLFLIDGGKGQLGMVRPVLEQKFPEGYGLAALAKREEEVFIPGQEEPIDFQGHLKTRHLLQRVRDEAHRFAVGYHRIIRDRQAVTSLLREVRGIGPSRLRALLNRFESVKAVQEAPLEELASVPGFSKELAHQLFKTFHPNQTQEIS